MGLSSKLSKLYYNERSPAGLSSPYRLYLAARKEGLKVNLKQVSSWLSTQDAYSMHRKVIRNFPRNPVIVFGPSDVLSYDYTILPAKLVRANKGYTAWLILIDLFSRYAMVWPVRNKSAETAARILEPIFKEVRPAHLFGDKEPAFQSKLMRALYVKYHIIYYTTTTGIKSSIVERCQRTLKERVYKYLTAAKTNYYLDKLPEIVYAYNHTPIKTLGVAPAQVSAENTNQIFLKVYAPLMLPNARVYRYKAGNLVKIALPKEIFKKGYEETWTKSNYLVIARRKLHRQNVYKLRTLNGYVMPGWYQEPSLSKVSLVRWQTGNTTGNTM